MKKGIELPINALIIIVIAIVVLITLISLYFSASGSSSSLTSQEAATKATCLKVNPTLCNNGKYNGQARATVDNFDANKNGKINDFHVDGVWPTTYCVDDNLETLCGFWFGCKINPCPAGAILPAEGGTFDPFNVANYNLVTGQDEIEWYECCVKRICGC